MCVDIDDLDALGMGPACPDCGGPTDWLRCHAGCDEGVFTYEDHLQFEDPLWYDVGDEEPCADCNGRGGWWFCSYCGNSLHTPIIDYFPFTNRADFGPECAIDLDEGCDYIPRSIRWTRVGGVVYLMFER